MQSADRFYTCGAKRFMLGSHLSAEEQKNPTLTPQQISHLKREPCGHISSHSSLNLPLFPSGVAVPLQAGDAFVPKQSHINGRCHQGDLWVVFPPAEASSRLLPGIPEGAAPGRETEAGAACGPAAPKEY